MDRAKIVIMIIDVVTDCRNEGMRVAVVVLVVMMKSDESGGGGDGGVNHA